MAADAGESNGRRPDAVVEEVMAAAASGFQHDHMNCADGKEEEGEGIRNDSPEKKVVPDSEYLTVDSPDKGVGDDFDCVEDLRVDSPDRGDSTDFVCVEESSARDDESALQASAALAITTMEETEEEEQREVECPVEGCEPGEEKDDNREFIMDNGGSHQEQEVAVVLSSELKAAEAANAAVDVKAEVYDHAETAEVENSGNEESEKIGSDSDREADDGTGIIMENDKAVQLGETNVEYNCKLCEAETEMKGEVDSVNDQGPLEGPLEEETNGTSPGKDADGRSEEKSESTVELGEELSAENSAAKVAHIKEPVSVDGAHEGTLTCTAAATDDGQANSASAVGDRHESQEGTVSINGVSNSALGQDATHEAPNSAVSTTDDESAAGDRQERQEKIVVINGVPNSALGDDTTHEAPNSAVSATDDESAAGDRHESQEKIVVINGVPNSALGDDTTHEAPNSAVSATDDESAAGDRHESQEKIVVINGVPNSALGDDTTHEAPNSAVSATDDESVAGEEQKSQESEASNSAPGEAHKVEQADTVELCSHIEVEASAMIEEKLGSSTIDAVANGHEQPESIPVEVEEEDQEQEQEPEQLPEAVTAYSEKLEPVTEVLSANQPQQDISKDDTNDEASPLGTEDESNADACSKEGDEVNSTPVGSKKTYASVVASGSLSYSSNHLTRSRHVKANLNRSAVAKPGSFSTNRAPRFSKVATFAKVEVIENTRAGVSKISELKHEVEGVVIPLNNDHESSEQYAECNKQSTLKMEAFDGRSLDSDKKAPSIPVQSTRAMQPVTTVASEVKPESPKIIGSSPFLPVAQKKKRSKPKNRSEATSKEPIKAIASGEPNNEIPDDLAKVRRRDRGSYEKSTRKAEERARKEEELEKERIAAELQEKLKLEQRAKAQEAEGRKKRRAEKAQVRAEQRAQKEAELKEKKRAKKDKALAAPDTTEGDDDVAGELPTFEKNPTKIPKGPRGAATTSSKSKKFKRTDTRPLPLRNRRSSWRIRTWMWTLLTLLVVLVLFLSGEYISTSTFKLSSFGF